MRCVYMQFNEDWEWSDKEEHAYIVFMGGHNCNVRVCYNFEVGWKMTS